MRRVWNFLRQIWYWLRGRPAPFRVERVLDVPEKLAAKTVYLIGEREHLWAAAFVCPCGCGEVIQLSLLADSRPSWSMRQDADGNVTLHPSVWRVRGCRSHFFLRRGLVEWVDSRS